MAFEEGGSIKSIGLTPYLDNNIFANNLAIYGQDIASSPVRLKFQIFQIVGKIY